MLIALDPGFGNTKVVVDGKSSILHSAVVKPNHIGNAAIGMKQHETKNEIVLHDQKYVAGTGAWLKGESIGSMDYSALADSSRLILFYAGLSKSIPSDKENKANLVIGLPVDLLRNDAQSNSIIQDLGKMYKTLHCWESAGNQYNLKIQRVHVLAQPVGAWADWAITEDIHIRKDVLKSEVAIMDIGMNTLDLFVIRDSMVIDKYIGGAKVGVRKLLETMNGHGQSIEEIDHDLRSNRIHANRDSLKSWQNEVMGEVEKCWPDLRRFERVIPVGGGVMFLGDMLKEELEDKRAKVYLPENPIATNAIGLWKWAAYNAKK